jgi:hypothetical protein
LVTLRYNTNNGGREMEPDFSVVTRAAAIYLRLQILDSEAEEQEEAQEYEELCEQFPELRKAEMAARQLQPGLQNVAENSASAPKLSEKS